jgi:CHAT domain-containing protein
MGIYSHLKAGAGGAKRGLRVIAFGNPEENLNGAEKEVDSLHSIYGENAVIHTGKEATKERFLSLACRYPVVHVAAHGRLSHISTRSYLALAPKDSGRLTVGELRCNFDLRLDCSLLICRRSRSAVEIFLASYPAAGRL